MDTSRKERRNTKNSFTAGFHAPPVTKTHRVTHSSSSAASAPLSATATVAAARASVRVWRSGTKRKEKFEAKTKRRKEPGKGECRVGVREKCGATKYSKLHLHYEVLLVFKYFQIADLH